MPERNPYRDRPTVLIPMPMHVLDVKTILDGLDNIYDGTVVTGTEYLGDGPDLAEYLVCELRSHPGPEGDADA